MNDIPYSSLFLGLVTLLLAAIAVFSSNNQYETNFIIGAVCTASIALIDFVRGPWVFRSSGEKLTSLLGIITGIVGLLASLSFLLLRMMQA